jgi:hypothetical protein
MKLFSLNYVREGILMLVVIIFSGILFWNVMRRSRLEGVDATLKMDAATTAAMKSYENIAKSNDVIAKAETNKKNAQKLFNDAKPTEKADAQSKYDMTIAEADAVIAKAKADITKAETANTK